MEFDDVRAYISECLLDEICWQVRASDVDSAFLTLEFGAPHLIVREPGTAAIGAVGSTSDSHRVRPRRRVYVHGDWHLWVQQKWTLRDGRRIVGSSSDDYPRRVASAAWLDGQCLSGVRFNRTRKTAVLQFDLGGRLTVGPAESRRAKAALWALYCPGSRVLRVYGDGHGDLRRSA